MTEKRNCPFYGVSTFPNGRGLMDALPLMVLTEGNRCGLITGSHSPCKMEIAGKPVEWSECPVVEVAITRLAGVERSEVRWDR